MTHHIKSRILSEILPKSFYKEIFLSPKFFPKFRLSPNFFENFFCFYFYQIFSKSQNKCQISSMFKFFSKILAMFTKFIKIFSKSKFKQFFTKFLFLSQNSAMFWFLLIIFSMFLFIENCSKFRSLSPCYITKIKKRWETNSNTLRRTITIVKLALRVKDLTQAFAYLYNYNLFFKLFLALLLWLLLFLRGD